VTDVYLRCVLQGTIKISFKRHW